QVVVERYGAVWFGKIGQPVGQATAELMRKGASAGSTSYLFLVQRRAPRPDVFRAPILDVSFDLASDEARLIPTYYGEVGLTRLMRSWIKIGPIDELPSDTLDTLTVVSSGRVLRDALRRSMAGSFLVEAS